MDHNLPISEKLPVPHPTEAELPTLLPKCHPSISCSSLEAFFQDPETIHIASENQIHTFNPVFFEILVGNAELLDIHRKLDKTLEDIIAKYETLSSLKREVRDKAVGSIEKRMYLRWMKLRRFRWLQGLYILKSFRFSKHRVTLKIYDNEVSLLGHRAIFDLNILINKSDRVRRLMECFLKASMAPENRPFVMRMNAKGLLILLTTTHSTVGISLKCLRFIHLHTSFIFALEDYRCRTYSVPRNLVPGNCAYLASQLRIAHPFIRAAQLVTFSLENCDDEWLIVSRLNVSLLFAVQAEASGLLEQIDMDLTLSRRAEAELYQDISKGHLPLRFPIVKLFPDSHHRDEQVIKFIYEVCNGGIGNPVVEISDGAKPFLSVVYDIYTTSGELKEKTNHVVQKVQRISTDIRTLNTLLQQEADKLSWLTRLLDHWPLAPLKTRILRWLMYRPVSQLIPVIDRICNGSKELVKDVHLRRLHHNFKTLNTRISRQYLYHTSLPENAPIQDELEGLKVNLAITLLLLSVLKDVGTLDQTQAEFSHAAGALRTTFMKIGHGHYVHQLGL